MRRSTTGTLEVQGTAVTVITQGEDDYISLTDMVRGFVGGPVPIEQWLKNNDDVLCLGVWDQLYNPDSHTPEFEGVMKQSGWNSFTLTPKQLEGGTE